jgi:hypothetical protein
MRGVPIRRHARSTASGASRARSSSRFRIPAVRPGAALRRLARSQPRSQGAAAMYSRCTHDALPMYSSPRIGTPAQRLRRRVPAAGCIRPDAGASGRQACQDSTADGVNGQHGGLRSSADGVREGEAASVRMGGVKRGVAQAQVGTAFSLGDRADPLGASRTRIFIV